MHKMSCNQWTWEPLYCSWWNRQQDVLKGFQNQRSHRLYFIMLANFTLNLTKALIKTKGEGTFKWMRFFKQSEQKQESFPKKNPFKGKTTALFFDICHHLKQQVQYGNIQSSTPRHWSISPYYRRFKRQRIIWKESPWQSHRELLKPCGALNQLLTHYFGFTAPDFAFLLSYGSH